MFPALDADKIRSYMHDNMANNLKILGKILRSVISGGMAIVNLISLLLITPVVAFTCFATGTSSLPKYAACCRANQKVD